MAKTLYPSKSLDLLAVVSEVYKEKPHFLSASVSSTKCFHGSKLSSKSDGFIDTKQTKVDSHREKFSSSCFEIANSD